jgi:uncharacterized membrane protein YhaH (DUF805 family)
MSVTTRCLLTLLKVLSSAKSEFLRFSDFRGRSNQQEFWSLALVYYANIGLFLVLATSLQVNQVNFVLQALVIFLQVPFAAVVVRRLQDIAQFRYLIDKVSARGGKLGLSQKAGNVLVAIVGTSLWLALATSFGFMFYLLLAFAGAAPSDTMNRRKINNKPGWTPTTSTQAPPPPPSGAQLAPHHEFSAPKFQRNDAIKTPKKRLSQRILFWLSLLAALLFLLLALFPSLISKAISGFELPNVGISVSPSPTQVATESPLTTPTPTPTDGLLEGSTSGSVDTGVGANNPDAGIVVGLDPRFRYCTHAIAAGYGPYRYGVNPEYAWYRDRDGDGIVCER